MQASAVSNQQSAARLTRKLAAGTVVFVSGVAAGKGLFLVVQLLLGRVLGPEGYGLYSLGFSLVMLAVWLASLGLDWGVLRYCSLYWARGEEERAQRTLWFAVLLALGSSLLVAGLVATGAGALAHWFFREPELVPVVRLFALSLPFYVVMRLATTFFQARQHYVRMTLIQHLVQPVVNVLLVLGAFALGWGLKGAVGAFLVSVGVAALWGVRLIGRELSGLSWGLPERPAVRRVLAYSLGLTAIGVSYQALLRIPKLLLGSLGSAEQVGVYSAAANLAMVLSMMPALFASPFLPVIVGLWEKGNQDELKKKYQTVVRWSLSVVLPVFLLLILFRNEVMGLFGPRFREGAPVLLMLSVGWMAYFAKGSVAGLLDMTGRQKLDLLNLVLACFLNFVLNLLLIPQHGAWGAGLAAMITLIAWAVTEYTEARWLFRLSPWNQTVVSLLGVTMASAVLGFLFSRWLAWPLAAALYLGAYSLLYLQFCLDPEDREVLQAGWDQLRMRWLGRQVLGQSQESLR